MFSLDLNCTQEAKDLTIAELWEEGSAGIVELEGDRLRAFFNNDKDKQRLAVRFGAEAKATENIDWIAISQSSLHPMAVGDRFFLVPEWRADLTPEGRHRIEVNNGLAFGTGRHETTQLCMELLEKYVQPGMTVIDVGTGSGILAHAAMLLGAALVVGCDIDPLAAEVAARRGVTTFIGSSEALRDSVADVVVANISPGALRELSSEWPRLLKSGGYGILSGVEIHDEVPFTSIEVRDKGEWRALVIRKP